MTRMVLSVVGSDRPGLTRALAAAVARAGGNWLESHLSRLGGLYVGSVLVDPGPGGEDRLRLAVAAVDDHGLEVRLVATTEPPSLDGGAYHLDLVGQDQPGIVSQVTDVLSGLGANIESFKTWVSAEPYSGLPLFHLEARLRLPRDHGAEEIQAVLEAISAEIIVDMSLKVAD